MKVFILACLVALALASEETLSISSEESTETINEKLQMVEQMEQLQAKEVLQDKVHPFIHSQPQAFPYDQPISCTPFAQNTQPIAQPLPVAQPPVVPSLGPVLSPELQALLKDKATILPKHKAASALNPETLLHLINSQVLRLANLANQHIPQAQVQALAQTLQAFLQTPVVSSQTQLTIPQSTVLYLLQQVAPFLQTDMPAQALLQYPALQFPANQPPQPIIVSRNLLPLKFPSKCAYDNANRRNGNCRMEEEMYNSSINRNSSMWDTK
ncbi:beta-casein [Microtus ochrogaster]|uniref:Beta-casein n=1 Tax=Microtus ochrogaster TaxID=79684 RepID=A0ABM1UFR5_MICOH|nr:beta-casein [Microtus ochrogaster]